MHIEWKPNGHTRIDEHCVLIDRIIGCYVFCLFSHRLPNSYSFYKFFYPTYVVNISVALLSSKVVFYALYWTHKNLYDGTLLALFTMYVLNAHLFVPALPLLLLYRTSLISCCTSVLSFKVYTNCHTFVFCLHEKGCGGKSECVGLFC